MEQPYSALTFQIKDILRLRATPDVFYYFLAKLTNSQLREFCEETKELKVCQEKGFWQNLWKAHDDWEKPQRIDNLQQEYYEKNLLDSLIEDILNNPQLLYELAVHIFTKADIASGKSNLNREHLQYILLPRGEDKTGPLDYADVIANVALRTHNSDLLYYYLLHLDDIKRSYIDYQAKKEVEKEIDTVLEQMQPLSRLPFIERTSLVDLTKFINRSCSETRLKILDAFFDSHREDKKKQVEELLRSHSMYLDNEKICTELRNKLTRKIFQFYPDLIPSLGYLFSYKRGDLFYQLLQPDQVNGVIKYGNGTVVYNLLRDWNIDRIKFLEELRKEDIGQFMIILDEMAKLNLNGEEQHEEYQEQIYQYFKSVRGIKGLGILFLKNLRGSHLISGLEYVLEKEGTKLVDLYEIFKSPIMDELDGNQIEVLMAYVKKKKPTYYKELRALLPE